MTLQLGEWIVEPSRNRISKAGAETRLEPKVMELLVLLTDHANAVVTKAQITERLWPGTFVTESSIFRHVSELRRALGDDPKRPRYVHTIPKKGYRVVMDTPKRKARRRSWRPVAALAGSLAGIAVLFALSGREETPRIAVLPFRLSANVEADSGDRARVAEGIGAMLRNKLALLQGMEIVEALDVAQARELDARASLGGTVDVSNDEITVVVELLETASGESKWSHRYRGTFEAIAALQYEMVVSIAGAMDAEITARDAQRLARQGQGRPVRSGAYQAYLRGELFENRVDCGSFDRAIEHYSEAMHRDENYLDVYPKLFDALVATAVLGCRPAEPLFAELEVLLDLAERNGLDETRKEQGRAAFSLWRDGDVQDAIDRFRAAEASASTSGTEDLSLAVAFLVSGRPEDGIREAKRCLEALPIDLGENWALGQVFYLTERYDEAIDQFLATLELYPDYRPALQFLALSYLMAGDEERALATAARAEPLQGERWARFDAVPAYVYAMTGDETQARAMLAKWTARMKTEWVPKWSLALIHVGLGERAQAQKWLQLARAEQDPWMVVFAIDPAFHPLADRERQTSWEFP